MELRIHKTEIELRSEGGKDILSGYAAVFDTRSQPIGGQFVEVVKPGAFTKTIKEADVRALLNHDRNWVLGRTRSGTLKLSQDATGLYYEVDPPNTTAGRDAVEMVKRGDISQSSFGFSVVGNGETWAETDDGWPERALTEVRLYDVSPVAYPAYLDTTVELGERALVGLAELRSIDPSDLSHLATQDAIALLLRGEELPIVGEQPEAPPTGAAPLDLLYRQLALRKPAA